MAEKSKAEGGKDMSRIKNAERLFKDVRNDVDKSKIGDNDKNKLRKTISSIEELLKKDMSDEQEVRKLCDQLPEQFRKKFEEEVLQSKKGRSSSAPKAPRSESPPRPSSKESKGGKQGDGSRATPAVDNKSGTGEVHTPPNLQLNQEQEQARQKLQSEYDSMKVKFEARGKELEEKEEQIKQLDAQFKKANEEKQEAEKDAEEAVERLTSHKKECEKHLKELASKIAMITNMEHTLNEYAGNQNLFKQEIQILGSEIEKLQKERRQQEKNEKGLLREIESLKTRSAEDKRKYDESIQTLIRERDDIRDRFSKVAGEKLSNQNSDIADLSDPNRAMKLAEKYGQLYDDEWTNAFEALTDTDKKICLPQKDAIDMLLNLLKECLEFCKSVKDSHLDTLANVFLHPVQNSQFAAKEAFQNIQGKKEQPRITSKDEKMLRELRRQITVQPAVIEQVKQAFLVKVNSLDKEKKSLDKKSIEACAPYLLKCAELCWLIVLHDPPLFVKFDVKHGDKLDPNIFSVYSLSGDTIDFLVWPPLFNGESGGLLGKGTAEPQKTVKKSKKA